MSRLLYAALRRFSSAQHALHERLTPAGRLVLGAGAAAGALGVDTTRAMTFQAFALLSALFFLALLLAPRFRARVAVTRELPRYGTAGEPVVYRVRVRNLGPAPLRGATVQEALRDPRPTYEAWRRAREPGEARRNWFDRRAGYFRWRWLIERHTPRALAEVLLPDLGPAAGNSVKLVLEPRRRGRIELAGLTLARPDPLGLVKGLVRLPAPAHLTVLPRRYRLPPLPLPGARRHQQGRVAHASSVGDSEEFLSLREYRPGDPLQHVHWKSFARLGRPVVKEFQDEFFERHALVLDTSTEAGEDAAFEEAVAVAASFVYAVDTRECLLDLLFVGTEVHGYTAGRGQLHPDHLLEVLAAVGPSAPAALAALARGVLARQHLFTSCILVLLGWDAPRRTLVEALRRAGVQLRVLVLGAPEARPAVPPPEVSWLQPGAVEAGLANLR